MIILRGVEKWVVFSVVQGVAQMKSGHWPFFPLAQTHEMPSKGVAEPMVKRDSLMST